MENASGGTSVEIGVEDNFTLTLTDDERAALSNTVDPNFCDLFTIQDVTLNDQSDSWSCTTGTYEVNGFCSGCTATDTETWLVSAGYNFSGATSVGFEYSTSPGFDDNSNLPELRVSTDYAGDVSTATWTTITTIDNDDGDDVFVNLTTDLAGEAFGVVAIRYVSIGSSAEEVTLSDVELLGNGITLLADPEPTNQPTSFAASRLEFDVVGLSWTDAVAGAQAPAGYLVLGSTGAITDPMDGVSPAEDLDPTDGSLTALIPFGTTEVTFEGFDGGDTFNFAIYSYTNSADAIDYNVTSAPSLAGITTPDEIFLADFEGLQNLYNISKLSVHDIDATDSWYYDSFSGDNFAEMSSDSDGDTEEDWMVIGPFNFDAYTGETFSFVSSLGFDANGTPISVRYSTDFSGNVSDAMWTPLSPVFSAGSFNDTYSGLIDVSGISGQVYFAFVYEEDETAMAEVNGTVQIDDIKISGISSATGVTAVASASASTNLSLAASTTTTGNVTVNDLTIGDIDNAILTVASGNTLTVYGNVRIEADGGLVIQDGASLITNGELFEADGDVTIERSTSFSTTAGRYSTVGSIVQDQSTSTLGSLIYKYNESVSFDTDNGLSRFEEVTSPEVMAGGVGYFSANTGDLTLGGVGTIPNNGGFLVPATFSGNSMSADNDGFNLVANPYPSSIDFLNFLAINRAIDGSIYIWDDGGSEAGRRTNADYITVNDLGTASAGSSRASDWDGNIRSGQGFFIRTVANVDVVFTNDIRVSGNNDSGGFFRQETRETADKLNLSIANDDFMSTTLIGFKADATEGRDRKYDAYKYAGNADLQIYSLIDESPFAIQGLPSLSGADYTVNLGYTAAEAGIYTINADEIVIAEGYQVILTDKLLDIEVNLSDLGSYTFTTQPETANDNRFSVSFRTSVISSVNEEIGNKLLVYSDFQNVHISLENGSLIDQFTVYTLSGQELISGVNNEQSVKVNKDLFSTGVNIIKAKSGDATFTLKFILK
ncbi:MAG: choice-of-anchor J domain-containing protein [Bacteroidota bacterium]